MNTTLRSLANKLKITLDTTIIKVEIDWFIWNGIKFKIADFAGEIISGKENTAIMIYNHLAKFVIIPLESGVCKYNTFSILLAYF